jgi:hypothetical protein
VPRLPRPGGAQGTPLYVETERGFLLPTAGGDPVKQPVLSGPVPPPAQGFAARPESALVLEQLLVPGGAVALVPPDPGEASGWRAVSGRTQLAASAVRSRGWPGGLELVVWVTAESRASVLQGYAQAASGLGLDCADGAEAAAFRLTAWLRSAPRPWLVVLDGLGDPAVMEGLWPAGGAGRVLVTASGPDAAEGYAKVLSAGGFSPREAVSYLSDRLADEPDSRSGQADLAHELGGEPAALAHAAAVVETSELNCRDYLAAFAQERDRLQAAAGQELPAGAATWRLSAQFADVQRPGAWRALVLAALLPRHEIPLAVLTAPAACRYLGLDGADPGRAWAVVRVLASTGLLETDTGAAPPVVRMSSALQASVLAAAGAGLTEQAAGAAADALLETWPDGQPETVPPALLCSCAAALAATAGDALLADGRRRRLLLAAGRNLDAAGLPAPAPGWWLKLTRDSTRLLGERHADTVTAAGLLAGALLVGGKTAEALGWAEWTAEARTAACGPGHRDTVAARIVLGRALTAAGRPSDAVSELEAAARAAGQVHGPVGEASVTALEAQAAALLAGGQGRQAARLLEQLLGRLEKHHGQGGAAALAVREQLGAALLAAGQHRAAVSCYRKLTALLEEAGGTDDPRTLAAVRELAGAYSAAGRMSEALACSQQAAAGYGRALGAGHPAALEAQGDLADLLHDLGHVGDAVAVLNAAAAVAEEQLPPGDPAALALQARLGRMNAATAAP